MLMRLTCWRACGLVVAVVLLSVAGCSKEESAKTETAPKAEAAAEKETEAVAETETTAEGLAGMAKDAVAAGKAELSAQLTAKLAEADKLDGKTDKVIEKCPGCGLKMDGKSEHALEVSGYTMHFCSDTCQKEFAKNLTKSVEDLKIPEP
jgi:YHS domain-containing protein